MDKSGLPLAAKEWYYGPISRSQCDTLLNSRGHDGDYLIRDSETNVSSIVARAENNYLLQLDSSYYFLLYYFCDSTLSTTYFLLVHLYWVFIERVCSYTDRKYD